VSNVTEAITDPGAPSVAPGSDRNRESVFLTGTHLAKSFGASVALSDASFELRSGEVHALVGENGSGKSTLVKILTGVQSADSGEITIEGRPVSSRRNPRLAQADGIVAVFQEVLVVESQTVLENLWLGADSLVRRREIKIENKR